VRRYLLGISLLLTIPTPARAARSYALVVGSNRAGPGQKALRFAHNDARQVRMVLAELGGYAGRDVRLLLDPDRRALLRALDRIRDRLQRDAARGERTVFFFFYSGHARARALNLGREELALDELRRRLADFPSTVTVAVLDACQTGAISRVKGAAPTADFSYNSVNDLNARGLVVMASSAASELSQEADRLRGSYFTHNLVVGLRGAADADSDGGVTLSEAYRYTYNRTLVATASTAVGGQHVTLETKLRGRGEMVLTRPARAMAALKLPRRLSAQVLVHRQPGQTVVADLGKAPGREVRLALPPGQYRAIVRPYGHGPRRCDLRLARHREHELRVDLCAEVPPDPVGVKGREVLDDRLERWSLEMGLGGLRNRHDRYTDRLADFGFDEQKGLFDWGVGASFQISVCHSLTRHVSLVAGWTRLDSATYEREVHGDDGKRHQSFEWSAHAIGLYARGTLPLADGMVRFYLQGGGGLGWADTVYRDPLQASEVVDDQLDWGYHLALHGGMSVMPSRYIGVYGQLGYIYAPLVDNLVGDTHDSGGFAGYLGVRVGF